MARRLVSWALVLWLLIGLGIPAPAQPVWAQPAPVSPVGEGFSFIHLTDPHVGSAAGNTYTPQIVAEIVASGEKPAFVVVGGDLTELGGSDQYQVYDSFLAPLGVPVYHALGNHESRWLDAGKGEFMVRYGRRYYAFSRGGVRFVVLDSSVSNQTHGHFEPLMLNWLREQLRGWGPQVPVVIFLHHPVGYPGQRFADNEEEFLEAIEGYNVVAVFAGHGHVDASWRVNGVPFFMTSAAMNGGYKIVRVKGGSLELYAKKVGEEPVSLGSVPLVRGGGRVEILSPRDGSQQRGEFEVRARGRDVPPEAVAECRVDGGPWRKLVGREGVAVGTVGGELVPGYHQLTVRVSAGEATWIKALGFWWEPASGTAPRVSLAWKHATGGGLQAPPLADPVREVVYFGSNDGVFRCLGARDGKKRWQVATSGPILGAPCLAGELVCFGSADGRVFGVEAKTGKVRWEFAAGAPVVASLLVVGDALYVGNGRGTFYALDARTGKEKWRFQTGGLIRSGAAYGRGMVFFGSWDGYLYALRASSGELVWKRKLARQVYYAPVGGSPLFYLDRVYVTTPSDPHAGKQGLHVLEAATGEVLWQSTVPAGLSTPVVQNLAVVVNSAGGSVSALHPLTGEVWGAVGTEVTVYDSSVIPYGAEAVMGGLWGEVVACDLWNGQESWRYRLGFRFLVGRVAALPGYLFVPSLDGSLYALKVKPTPPPPLPPAFPDTAGHWAQESVAQMARLGLIKGYEDGSFRPGGSLTRAEMAAICARYLGAGAPGEGFSPRFADVRGHWAEPFVLALEQRGLVKGETTPDGVTRFRPDDPLTRAELAALVARLRGTEGPSPAFRSRLSDVGGSWAKEYIWALEEQGLVSGYRQGTKILFAPAARATRAEVATLFSRLAATFSGGTS